ncbi:NADH-quinone oxidoreductase subunit H [Methanobrevibacter sp. TMH8]|uniref:respiratory chain complex I subunit 1 family protein n=1 Tax=Methanobrevibacter sp. TMH8 TaxID=2848611 RepID=UPI001CCE80DB|nr:NADH-quinone oxidoreductase subunit H [Methanobrevibacter sp. TMH8]MBZ9571331.1 NADH-quinone oxidoreductase subunit H [Methanobrevibacter sp. TMH8]
MNLMANIIINVIIAFLVGSLLLGFHRKVMARIQLRPGPPIIQHFLHSLKFFFKESSFPKTASMPFYVAIASMYCAIWIVAVIVGPVTYGSLLLIFAIYAVYKIVEHNAGSSSGSPYGKMSCVRAVFSAAAEIPLFAVLAIVFLQTGTMNIGEIIAYQSANGPLIFSIPLAALMFFILLLSKSPYSPFSITKGKDIISGFETEHFGVLRGYMMLSESISWYILLWVFLTVFFGPLSILWYLIGMVVITAITALINATTPILNPNHSVMSQITIAIVGIGGSILLMFIV